MIIADTGYFVALANRADAHHEACRQALQRMRGRERLVTTWPVLTETVHLLAHRLGSAAVAAFVTAVEQHAFDVFQLEPGHHARLAALMRQYEDLPMDLADASLVVLAEERGDGRILSTDRRDFRTYRWKNRKPFKNLLDLP